MADVVAAPTPVPTPSSSFENIPSLLEGWTEDTKIIFASFYVAPGERPDIESHKPDMRFSTALRQSNPNCRIAFLTDSTTILDIEDDTIEIYRCPKIDRKKIGRNAWANYYQMVAQVAYLEKLEAEFGAAGVPNVVFMDTDMMVVDSVLEAFEGPPFDYGMTISDSIDMPINFGFQLVQKGRHREAIKFLEDVMRVYDFSLTFTAGQEAIAEYSGVMNKRDEVLAIGDKALSEGRCMWSVDSGKYNVCFFPCHRYNFCNCEQSCCTAPERGSKFIPKTAADYEALRIKVYHFVGHRKPGIAVVFKAFMEGGKQAAYEAMASLPDLQKDYEERFGPNKYINYEIQAKLAGNKYLVVNDAGEQTIISGPQAVGLHPVAASSLDGPDTPPREDVLMMDVEVA